MRTVLLCVGTALLVTIIVFGTSQLEVTLNESGTELLGLSFFKMSQPAFAKPAE